MFTTGVSHFHLFFYFFKAIVESVIENSKSFSEKTIFAQEKYIKKKESR